MIAPVIQRAASEAKKAITSATSSGLPIRFNACIRLFEFIQSRLQPRQFPFLTFRRFATWLTRALGQEANE